MKQGAIELQFNWIFIILVGALILIFFISIVNQQQKTSNLKLAFQVREKLDSIFAGAAAGPIERTESIAIPKLEITADCDNFYVGGQSVALPITIRPIFSPDLVKGDSLLLWSQDWSVPFAVSNFLYATSPEIRYIFVGSDPLTQKIYFNIPDTLSKELILPQDITSLKDKNNYKIKFIFINTDPAGYSVNSTIRTPSNDITAISVQGSTDVYGTIDFYKGSTFTHTGDQTNYIGTASLYGAIFSENTDNYNCLMNKAFKKLSLVADLYANRSLQIEQVLSSSQDSQANTCRVYHASAEDSLSRLSGAALTNFPASSQYVSAPLGELTLLNRQAIDSSCPAIY